MGVSGERVLSAIRRAVDVTVVPVDADEVLARRRLEGALEVEFRREGLTCSGCGDLEWEPED